MPISRCTGPRPRRATITASTPPTCRRAPRTKPCSTENCASASSSSNSFSTISRRSISRAAASSALMRWNRPGAGLVGPGVFLPRAEENGIIVPLNEWVLREACREAKSWQRMGLPPVRVGVNLSPVQFRKRTVPLLVAQVLAETGLDPRRLDLELTESIVVGDLDAVAIDLQQLLDMGVHVSIDDFGTGYSSLSYVKRFPVDSLKVDRSFIRDVPQDADDVAITQAIIAMAHSLGLKVIAEGVETEEQLDFLRELKCDQVQGYIFSEPISADEFAALLRSDMAKSLH